MRNLALGLLTVVLILSFTATAAAAELQYKKEIEFQPGGQTIGGPGFAEFDSKGSLPHIVFIAVDGHAAACTTVANVGDNPFDVLFEIFQPGFTQIEIPAGHTLTVCRSNLSSIGFRCGEERGGPSLKCKALWRVDEYRPISAH